MKPHFAFAVYGADVSEYKDLSSVNYLTIASIIPESACLLIGSQKIVWEY